jgi:hypothetical protein
VPGGLQSSAINTKCTCVQLAPPPLRGCGRPEIASIGVAYNSDTFLRSTTLSLFRAKQVQDTDAARTDTRSDTHTARRGRRDEDDETRTTRRGRRDEDDETRTTTWLVTWLAHRDSLSTLQAPTPSVLPSFFLTRSLIVMASFLPTPSFSRFFSLFAPYRLTLTVPRLFLLGTSKPTPAPLTLALSLSLSLSLSFAGAPLAAPPCPTHPSTHPSTLLAPFVTPRFPEMRVNERHAHISRTKHRLRPRLRRYIPANLLLFSL